MSGTSASEPSVETAHFQRLIHYHQVERENDFYNLLIIYLVNTHVGARLLNWKRYFIFMFLMVIISAIDMV